MRIVLNLGHVEAYLLMLFVSIFSNMKGLRIIRSILLTLTPVDFFRSIVHDRKLMR